MVIYYDIIWDDLHIIVLVGNNEVLVQNKITFITGVKLMIEAHITCIIIPKKTEAKKG